MKNITLDVAEDGIAVATLDMPGRPFNVFSDEMLDDLEALIEAIEGGRCRGVVVTSGKEAFMAGADLAMVKGFTTLRFHAGPDVIRARFSRLTRLLRRLERVTTPTVAAINGLALGGGLELAMACHHRVAAAAAQPTLGLPEVLLGLLPGAGGTQRLPRLIGAREGAAMLLGGSSITPAVGHEWGLIDAVVPPEDVLAYARRLAASARPGARWDDASWQPPTVGTELLEGADAHTKLIAAAGLNAAITHLYPALRAICRCLVDGYVLPFDAALDVEIENFLILMLDPVAGNMVRTGFLSKTAAPKRAAQRLGQPRMPVRTLAWLGDVAPPGRLQSTFKLTADPATADATMSASPVATLATEPHIWLKNVLNAAHDATAAAEIRIVGALDHCEAAEIAGEGGELAARALACANRLRLIPIAAAAVTPGPSERLARVAADWFAAQRAAGHDLTGVASAHDLGTLMHRLGVRAGGGGARSAAGSRSGLELLSAIAVEAARCLASGLVATPEDLDVLGVFALGYPAWTGGPLSFLDMVRRGEIAGVAMPADAGDTVFYAS